MTGNIDEKVRHAVTKLADLHLVASEDARERVLRLGERPEAVHMTGCPSIDIARQVAADERAWRDFDPFEHYRGVGEPFDPSEPFVVVLQHPVTTQFDEARRQMSTTLAAIHELKIPAIVFWPNPDSGTEGVSEAIRSFREQKKPRSFYFYKNLKPDDFMRLLLRASCLVGNSSVGLRECSYLGVPVVNIGDRQRGRVRCANVCDVAEDKAQIKKAISAQITHGRFPSDHAYGDGKAGERIAEVLATAPLTIDKLITY